MMGLALASLARILAEPDTDLLAVLHGSIEEEFLDVARVGAPAHHIENPIAAFPVAAELDADRPIRVVELGLFGGREIPVADNVEVGRDRVEDGTPLPLEIEPGGRP